MNYHLKKLVFVFVVVALTLHSCGQKPENILPRIAPELLQKDFDVFRNSLKELHAGLYRYRDKIALDKLFDSCRSRLNHPMSLNDYYLMLRFLISNIEDGHTSCNMPSEIREKLISKGIMFPIQLVFIEDRAYIACRSNRGPLSPSTQITAIDNRPVNEIKNKLFRYLASDGKNQTKKYWDLNNEAFVPLYYLVYGEKNSFTIQYKTADLKTATIALSAESLKNVECRTTPVAPVKFYELNFQDNVAIITIRSFVSQQANNRNDYYDFLDSSFKEIRNKKVRSLIIDLRDNGGGHDVFGSRLYSYLTDKPFDYYTSLETTQRRLQESEHPNLSVQTPQENNFKGKVFVLINGKSFSTTTEFCSIAKTNERAIFIGEETGGGYYGNTSGASERVILPNTKITVNIPKTKYTMAVKPAADKDRGIMPDHTVVPGIHDIIEHKDVQLNYALKLAGRI